MAASTTSESTSAGKHHHRAAPSWDGTTAATLLATEFSLIQIDSSAKVEHALKAIADANIYCVPVVDHEARQISGLVDLLDIVAYVSRLFLRRANHGKALGDDLKAHLEQLHTHQFSGEEVDNIHKHLLMDPVSHIVDHSKQNTFVPRSPDDTLRALVESLSSVAISRVPVITAGGNLVGLVSRSTVVGFVARHLDVLLPDAAVRAKSARDAQLISTPVVAVRQTQRAIEAFASMTAHGVSAVAVLDENGKLVGALSAKDIRGLHGQLGRALLSVREFVAHIRQESLKAVQPALYVHADDSLEKVIAMLATVKIHRLFVVDADEKPVGIISLADVVRVLHTLL